MAENSPFYKQTKKPNNSSFCVYVKSVTISHNQIDSMEEEEILPILSRRGAFCILEVWKFSDD